MSPKWTNLGAVQEVLQTLRQQEPGAGALLLPLARIVARNEDEACAREIGLFCDGNRQRCRFTSETETGSTMPSLTKP